MAKMTVYWRHEPFSHDAGKRDIKEVDRMNSDAARTGILTDEHQEVTEGRPVLVEDVTERVYRAADLPADTRVVVSGITDPPPPLVERAREAGFEVVSADAQTSRPAP